MKHTSLFVAAAAMAFAGSASAASSPTADASNNLLGFNNQVSISTGATYTDYSFHFDDGYKNSIKGWQPNFTITGSTLLDNNIYLGAAASYSFGHIDSAGYDADTASSDLLTLSIKAGYAYAPTDHLLLIPYITYGHRANKLKQNTSQGNEKFHTDDHIRYNYAGAGVILNYKITPRLISTADAMLGATFANSVKETTGFSSPAHSDSATAKGDIGSGFTTKIRLGLDYNIYKQWHVFGTAQYAYIDMGRIKHLRGDTDSYDDWATGGRIDDTRLNLGVRYTF